MRFRIILLAILIESMAFPLGSQLIRIPDRVEVGSDRLVLADLVPGLTGPLAGVSLGYAPYPGHHRWIERSELEHQILRSGAAEGLNLEMAERVLITRQSQLLQDGVVRQAIESYLKSSFPAFEIELGEVEMPQQVVLPLGSVDVRVASERTPRNLDGASLKVEFLVDGRVEKAQWVRLQASAKGEVVCLGRAVGYGEVIHSSDLVIEERELEKLEGDFVSDPAQVLGSVAKKALPSGHPLRSSDLRPTVLVERGETVTLIARGTSFKISTAAKAQAAGSLGDSIPVENLQSKQVVSAVVVAPGTAEVYVPEIRR